MIPAAQQNTERLFTIKAAAEQIGLPYWKLCRAVKRGLVPSHTLLNSKKLVRLSEIVAALDPSFIGGRHDY